MPAADSGHLSDLMRLLKCAQEGVALTGVNLPSLRPIESVRKAGIPAPIFVYTSSQAIEGRREEILSAGAIGATSSPEEVLEMLRSAAIA